MKVNFYAFKFLSALILAVVTAFYVTSCNKNNTSTPSSTVTEADAAQVTNDAVNPAAGGMTEQLASSTSIYQNARLVCGVEKDSTITAASVAGASPSYNLNFSWNYHLNCNGVIPAQVTYNFNGSGSYTGPLITASHKGSGQIVLTGLGVASSDYNLSLNYIRNGTSTSKIGAQHTFTSVLTFKSTNIAVDKASQQIVSGTATVSILATSSSGNSFNFNGTITFLGNKKATLVLNSGTIYTIQWL